MKNLIYEYKESLVDEWERFTEDMEYMNNLMDDTLINICKGIKTLANLPVPPRLFYGLSLTAVVIIVFIQILEYYI